MIAEEYLDQIKKIGAIIENKKRDHKRWEDIADGLGGFSVTERVQTTRNLQRGSNAILEYIGIEEEIKALEWKRQDIINTIQRLPYHEYRVIYQLYVEVKKDGDDYLLKELPSIFHKSYDWCKKKKAKGLKLIQKILDEKEG